MKTINTTRFLRQKIGEAADLLNRHELRHTHFQDWAVPARALLTVAFGRDDKDRRDFEEIHEEIKDIEQTDKSKKQKSQLRKERLPELIEILKKVWTREVGNKVFVSHGRDEGPLQTTARLLESFGLVPVILREQLDRGRTIIDKFEDYSDVAFAVILLTGDDRGGLATSHEELRLRARQNVILELGFSLGKLGREQVCALYQEGVEIPSNYSGVLFIPLDEGGAWKNRLAKELEAAGFSID